MPVLNSAGGRFAEPLMEVEKRLVIVIEKTYSWSDLNPATFSGLFGSVNINDITIADVPIPARGGRMLNLSPTVRVIEGETYDWRVGFEIEVKGDDKTYDREIQDRGDYYLEGLLEECDGAVEINGHYYRKVKFKAHDDETGEPITLAEGGLLDGLGGPLMDITPGNEQYITFRTKPEKDWTSLDLPRRIMDVVNG